MLTNGNDYRREGYELMVGATPIKTKDWKWDISFNWFQTRKYLDKIYNGAYNYNNLKVGDRADALYESVWQRDPQGNFIVFENNGRPIEDPFKRVIGYAGADWEFGISSTLRYRNWSLSFDIAGRVGGVIRSDLNARMIEAGTHKLTAAPERELDWTKTPSYIPSNAVVVVDGDIEYDDHGNVLYDTRGYAPSTTPVYFKSWIGYMGKLNGPYTMGYNLFKGDFIKLRRLRFFGFALRQPDFQGARTLRYRHQPAHLEEARQRRPRCGLQEFLLSDRTHDRLQSYPQTLIRI